MKILFVVANDRPQAEPALGVASIAAYLRNYIDNIEIKILQHIPDSFNVVKQYSPNLIGISCIVIQYSVAVEFANDLIKQMDIPVIVGGPLITLLPTLLDNVFDLGVIGEGEQTMLELVRLLEKENEFHTEQLRQISGLVFFDNEELIITRPREYIEPLDRIPMPARDLFNMQAHLQEKYVFGKSYGKGTHILTSRGCQFKCSFCSASNLWKKVRYNSPERVVAELKELIDVYQVELVHIYDTIFTADRPRLLKVVELIENEGINTRINIGLHCRVDLIDEEICSLLKRMGVVFIEFGFESGSQRILNFLNKRTTIQQAENAVFLSKKHGFIVGGTFMIGSPTETEDEMLSTLAFLLQLKLDKFDFYNVVPYPGTVLYDYCLENGLLNDPPNLDSFKQRNLDSSPIELNDILNNRQILLTKAVTASRYVEIHNKFRKQRTKLYSYNWTKHF